MIFYPIIMVKKVLHSHHINNENYLLIENNYQENKCLHVLEEMRQCCLKWHKESLCCSGIILDKPYIQKAENEKRAELLSRYYA